MIPFQIIYKEEIMITLETKFKIFIKNNNQAKEFKIKGILVQITILLQI
jgi:hypothetical protein